MTADEVKELLGLVPHPKEGGYFMRTYEAAESLSAAAFLDGRYTGARKTGTCIYYFLEQGTFSEMHRLQSDEVFHFYMGDAVEMLQLLPDKSGRIVAIGTDLATGERPQVVVERAVWQGARLKEGGAWALMGCSVSPGFEFEDYEAGRPEELTLEWAEFAGMIEGLTRE